MIFFDILLAIVIIYSFYYGLKHGISETLYDLTKVFLGFTFAGAYAYKTGLFLTKVKILAPDNYAIMKLIGFLLLFALYWGVVTLLEYIKKTQFKDSMFKTNNAFGGTINALQVFLFSTVALFLLMQFSIAKTSVRPYILKSYSYPKIEKAYKAVLSKTFVDNFISGNVTGTNSKEIFLQTITDEKLLKSIE